MGRAEVGMKDQSVAGEEGCDADAVLPVTLIVARVYYDADFPLQVVQDSGDLIMGAQ